MATLFSKIINGEIPGHFVWQDEQCVAFLVIDPLTDGHTIVVPREEVDQWTDAQPALLDHLVDVARVIGGAQKVAFESQRAGLMIAGFEVPHLHVHVWPTNSLGDFDLSKVTHGQDQQVLAANAQRLRDRLHADGHEANLPG
ncbi:HIT family protein [Calidifontibacter terrae]